MVGTGLIDLPPSQPRVTLNVLLFLTGGAHRNAVGLDGGVLDAPIFFVHHVGHHECGHGLWCLPPRQVRTKFNTVCSNHIINIPLLTSLWHTSASVSGPEVSICDLQSRPDPFGSRLLAVQSLNTGIPSVPGRALDISALVTYPSALSKAALGITVPYGHSGLPSLNLLKVPGRSLSAMVHSIHS